MFRVTGKMFKALTSLYNDVECAIRVTEVLSKWFKIPSRVKHGCLLSPALFSIFINDLAHEIKKTCNVVYKLVIHQLAF